jgi:glucose/arabinose dehydrogenase
VTEPLHCLSVAQSKRIMTFAGKTALAMVVTASWVSLAAAGVFGSKYRTNGLCGPFPRVAVQTPDWACLGIVAGPEHGFIWPRNILEVGKDRFVIADGAGWYKRGQGRVLSLEIGPQGRAKVTPLIGGRNLTHGLALGPDGRVYVGDDVAIWRFDPKSTSPRAEIVLDGLPGKPSRGGDHAHPLKAIVFDKDGNLLVNMGAPNDACGKGRGRRQRYSFPCRWRDGAKRDAALWKLEMSWPSGRAGSFAPLAKGLRNSLALAVHPSSGLIVQAENNIDLWGRKLHPNRPAEELNIILPGRDYGWPYCAGAGRLVPQYRGTYSGGCAKFEAPAVLMPAHAAPLALQFYSGTMFPELEGKLLAALHGSRANGHRLVAYDTNGDGRPLPPSSGQRGKLAFPDIIVDGWTRRPAGAIGRPSGLALARDGSIWIVDDQNKTVMVLLRSGEGLPARAIKPAESIREETSEGPPPVAGWRTLYRDVLSPRCGRCHEQYETRNGRAAWTALIGDGLINPDNVAASPVFQAIQGGGSQRPMPPPSGLKAWPKDLARVEKFLRTLPP